jgi:DNA (cytosine-5)-methyltransferase 1
MVKIGSLFAGIGGFELGFERAIQKAETLWQVEQNKYCQQVLSKHWPNAKIYNDVRDIKKGNVEPIDILLGGFPCQDLSLAGKGAGLNGKKSGLWWEMHRIIGEIRPRVVVMENVAAINIRGLDAVCGSLVDIGYDIEWTTISARQFGAPHMRKRWFGVAYSDGKRSQTINNFAVGFERKKTGVQLFTTGGRGSNSDDRKRNYWTENSRPHPIRRMDDGVSSRMDRHRIQALGNAIVPQCSEYIARCVLESGLIDDLLEEK